METYRDLGWANGWYNTDHQPPEYTACQAARHQISDCDIGPPYRGINHLCQCAVCKIQWHYDSSD